MPAKTEFKFNCPTCGQHILAATEWSGRKIDCPSCRTSITIPEPSKEKKTPAPGLPPSPATHPNYARAPMRVESPATDSPITPAKSAAPDPKSDIQPQADGSAAAVTQPVAAMEEPQQLRIAVLTPAVKLDLVRGVRRRLASQSAWLPGKVGGKVAYAAKVVDGEPVLVDVKEPQATRFSLLGAFLLELRQRRVVRTATGRTRFLDEEIPDVVRQVLMESTTGEACEPSAAPPVNDDWLGADHGQCLAVLDVLEELYSQRVSQAHVEKARRRLGTTRLPELIKKLERKARIEPSDVATALYHEVMELRGRLDRLEKRAAPDSAPRARQP